MTEHQSMAAALAELQAALPRIPKTVGGQHGKYAAYDKILARVRPVLAKHGFLWSTLPTMTWVINPPRFVLRYTLTHVPTGETISGDYPLTEGPAQQQGSQISYAKRYALVAALDLEVVGEDDDGVERTPAKVTGADHERLRNGTVEPTPDDRPAQRSRSVDNSGDPWDGQPAGEWDLGQPEDTPGSVDERQTKDLGIEFTKAGITDRAVRLGMVADLIGREILTSKQLSRAEAAHVLKALRAKREATT
jgi:ERF superfamily